MRRADSAEFDSTAKEGAIAAPLLQAQIDINAPLAKVSGLISDFDRMPQWSPQCRWMKSLGPLPPDSRTINLNRRKSLFWPTMCTVTELIPEKKLAFRVNTNGTIWSYELESTDVGTRVVESRHAENGITAVSNLAMKTLFGGVTNFEEGLVDGMNASLARIKAVAES